VSSSATATLRPERIRASSARASTSSGSAPGRTLVKPNIVAAGELFKHAYTRPEFVEGVLGPPGPRRLGAMTELAVGERCGITIPTRRAFEGAGYNPMLKRNGVKHYCFEEEPQVEIPLHPLAAAARLRLHAGARREGRLLRQLPEVQGPPVDHGDLLDEELHRDPGRPAPAHRPRPPAQREDRRPPVHHPAGVHRHRRDHRGRRPDAHAGALPAQPRDHGTTSSPSTRCAATSSASTR
jgi:hypothetical protein